MASIQQTPQGPVLVLKESALQQKGRDAQKNNIAAAKLVAELVKTSLGPRGLDKMLVDSLGDVTITNDGATILKEIDTQHPAATALIFFTEILSPIAIPELFRPNPSILIMPFPSSDG